MRNLSNFETATFDVVDQPYSLNFVPDASVVFAQVARVIKPNGIYRFMCANPFAAGMTSRDWNGEGYTIKRPYQAGEALTYEDQDWVYNREDNLSVPAPQEFRHTLGTLIDGLVRHGFIVHELIDVVDVKADVQAEPGTWDHFTAIIPPWFVVYAVYRPDVFGTNEHSS